MLRLLDILPFADPRLPRTPSDSSVPWEGSELRRKYLEPLQRCSTSECGSANSRRHREQAQKPSLHHSIPSTRRALTNPWCRTRDPSVPSNGFPCPREITKTDLTGWSVGC